MKNTKTKKELSAFASNLIKFMNLRGETRQTLSKFLGYADDRMIGRFIRGEAEPTLEVFKNICRHLKVDEMTMLTKA